MSEISLIFCGRGDRPMNGQEKGKQSSHQNFKILNVACFTFSFFVFSCNELLGCLGSEQIRLILFGVEKEKL